MSLRTGAIEAAAFPYWDTLGMFTSKFLRISHEEAMQREDVQEAATIVTAAALDALLDYLEAHTDEWSQAELDLHQKIASDDAWHNSHVDELRHLIAALRAES